MQDNHSRDFDAQLRSMLEDAEVKAPRRVWKGISARLDADAAPVASPWGWMKWAGMSLAAAAAIAAGLFFTGTRHSIPTNYYNQEQAMLAQAGEPAGADIDIPVEAPAAATAQEAAEVAAATLPARRSAPATRAAAPTTSATESPAAEAPAPSSNSVSKSTDGQAEPSGAPAGSSPARRSERQTSVSADPFSEPFTPAGRQKTSGIDLYAQGTLGSNDPDFRRSIRGAYMAPGEPSGFVEQGASSYGIPFTVGIGARFHLTPRLSLGTGLDYSLLTRTFAGSYQAVSGSVSHTMHYLGIPVKLYYDIISSDKIGFYVYGGGEIEYCVSNQYRLFSNPDIVKSYPVSGPQFSAGGGLGVEFRLTRRVGLYFDPGVNYYFPGNQPKSIRTEKPFLLNFDAGVRFNFGR